MTEYSWVITLLTGGASALLGYAVFWMSLGTQITTAREKAKTAMDTAEAAHNVATIAIGKCELQARDIGDNRVEMVGKVAALEAITKSTAISLSQAEDRLIKSIDNLGVKVDKLGETIIATLGTLISKHSQN